MGAEYVALHQAADIETAIQEALQLAAQNKPVYVDVRVDYSKPTRFTQGVVKDTLKRFAPQDKFRVVSRALIRKLTG